MFKNIAASAAGLWLIALPLFGLAAAGAFIGGARYVGLLAVVMLLALLGGIVVGCCSHLLKLPWLISLLASIVSLPLGAFLGELTNLFVPPCQTLNCPDDRIWNGLKLLMLTIVAGCGLQALAWLTRHFACKLRNC